MLRIKKTAAALFEQRYAQAALEEDRRKMEEEKERKLQLLRQVEEQTKEQLERLERARMALEGTDGSTTATATAGSTSGGAAAAMNPDEIDIDSFDMDIPTGNSNTSTAKDIKIEQRAVPAAVFGGIESRKDEDKSRRDGDGQELGALERMKKRKQG